MMRPFTIALLIGVCSASYPKIALYAPSSEVRPHANIDISAYAMVKFLGGVDYNGAALDSTTVTGATPVPLNYAKAKDLYDSGTQSSQLATFTCSSSTGEETYDSSETYTCSGYTGISSATFGSIKSTPTDTQLKVYLNTGFPSVFPCGNIPWDTAVTSETASVPQGVTSLNDCAGTCLDTDWISPYTEAGCPVVGDVTCVPSTSVTNITIVCSTTAVSLGGRSLKGFSTQAASKMGASGLNEPEFIAAQAFHGGQGSYGDDHIQLALNALTTTDSGTFSECVDGSSNRITTGATEALCAAASGTFTQGNTICKSASRVPTIPAGNTFAAQSSACTSGGGTVTNFASRAGNYNIEVAKKMAVYTNAWMYTIHEFEDAVGDCEASTINDNDAGVHAWDEGVAFYTGSRVGEDGTSASTTNNGNMIYELANKRCGNFGTCRTLDTTTTQKYTKGNSNVNYNLFPYWVKGQFACHMGDCAGAQTALNAIIPQMRIPLIQGTLRYAYKMEFLSGGEKESGEGYAFMMSVVHAVSACSADDAQVIYDAMQYQAGGLANGKTFADVKGAFERHYPCMGITCADIGELLQSDGTVYTGHEICTDPVTTTTAPDDDDDDLPTWAMALIIVFAVLAVLMLGYALRLIMAEKAGKPIYVARVDPSAKPNAAQAL